MSSIIEEILTDAELLQAWGYQVGAEITAAEAEQTPLGAWAHFHNAVGRRVPANVNKTIRLRAQIRALGKR
jgi:hypothetical protein